MFKKKTVSAPVEAPKTRTSQEIGTEFNNLAFKAGHLEFQIRAQQKEHEALMSTLAVLEVEFRQVKSREDADAAAKEQKEKTNAAS